MMTATTAIDKRTSPHAIHCALVSGFTLSKDRRFASIKKVPPIAAYTVALGIQAKARNIFSLHTNLSSLAATIVPSHLAIKAPVITATDKPSDSSLTFLNYTEAPTVAKTNGCAKVQNAASSFYGLPYSPHA